jgi:membrane protein
VTDGRPPRQGRLGRAARALGRAIPDPISTLRRRRLGAILLAVVADYDRAGGGLLAAGLAYEALFALLPGFLLAVGAAGLVVDAAAAAALAAAVGAVAPPLAPLAGAALDELRRGAVAFSLVGVIGLAWGAARLYRALDAAIGRIFHAAPRRSALARAVRGLVAVLVGLAASVGIVALVGMAAALEADRWLPPAVSGPLGGILPSGLAAVGFSAVAAAVYRWVPTRQVPWTALFPPAVAAGLAMAVVSQLFAILAPRLIGVGVLVGASVGVLAALLWLGIVFQVLLLGAAWTHWRVAGQEEAGAAETGQAGRGRG